MVFSVSVRLSQCVCVCVCVLITCELADGGRRVVAALSPGAETCAVQLEQHCIMTNFGSSSIKYTQHVHHSSIPKRDDTASECEHNAAGKVHRSAQRCQGHGEERGLCHSFCSEPNTCSTCNTGLCQYPTTWLAQHAEVQKDAHCSGILALCGASLMQRGDDGRLRLPAWPNGCCQR